MITDPIADEIIRIKNSLSASKERVFIPYSKLKFQIGLILAREGFIKSIEKKSKNHSRRLP